MNAGLWNKFDYFKTHASELEAIKWFIRWKTLFYWNLIWNLYYVKIYTVWRLLSFYTTAIFFEWDHNTDVDSQSSCPLGKYVTSLFSTRASCLHFDSARQKEKECSIPVSLTEQALGQDGFCNHCQFPVTTRWPAFSIVSLNGGGGMSMRNKNCRNKKT